MSTRPRLLILAFLLSAAALTPPPPSQAAGPTRQPPLNPSADIPMAVHRGLPIVEVWVDGSGPYRFGIDTGAMDPVVVGEALAAQLETADQAPTTEEDRVPVASLKIGDLQFTGISARRDDTISRLPLPIDGLLGLPLFADHLLTLDYPSKRVRIEQAELPEVDGGTILPLESHPTGLAFVELEIEGISHEALVDSGNLAAPLYLPESLASRLERGNDSSVKRTARTAGAEFTLEEVKLAGTVRLGRLVLEQPVVVFGGRLPKVILGGQAFSEHAVSIDQKNRRLRLSR